MREQEVRELRRELVRTAREMYRNRLVTATGGNLSVRIDGERILITPHGSCLGRLTRDELLVVGRDGQVVSGTGEPSSEAMLHLAIYAETTANAIVHAHPAYSIGLSAADARLLPITLESAFVLGDVETIPQHYPTTDQIAAKLLKALRFSNVAILKNHGTVAIGKTLQEAYFATETLEETARTMAAANAFGGVAAATGWDRIARQFRSDTVWFEWCVTNRCNAKCLYCYESSIAQAQDGQLSTEQALRIVDSLSESSRLLGRPFVICWSGGEPLLRDDIFQLIEHAHRQGLINSVATNGLNMTAERASRLKEAGAANVLISLDSVEPEVHDLLRGRGTHAKVLKALEHCKQANLFTVVETVANRLNYEHIGKIKDFCERELGLFYFYRPVLRVGVAKRHWDELGLSAEQFRELYESRNAEILRKIREGKARDIPVMRIFDLFPFMETPADADELEYLEWGVGCQACRILHGITHEGDLLPCIRLKHPLGNLLRDRFVDLARSPSYRAIAERKQRGGRCSGCAHLSLCGGGCLVEAQEETGDPLGGWSSCWS